MTDPFQFRSRRYKHRFSCWTGTAFASKAIRIAERLGYYAYEGPEAYADYIYVEADGEDREVILRALNERLEKGGAGPSDYIQLRFR